jgi:hypothetical protein
MTAVDAFEASLSQAAPSDTLDLALQALWWAGKGDWARAHHCVQQAEGTPRCDHVHAYLHRQEGDLGNAGYWYRRSGQPVHAGPLATEWRSIAARLLPASSSATNDAEQAV